MNERQVSGSGNERVNARNWVSSDIRSLPELKAVSEYSSLVM